MDTAQADIPFERQSEAQSPRTCGAACLSMAYRSFGKEVAQEQIWPAIAKKNRFGSISSTTHLMAQDALQRGFAAIAIQAAHPLQVLRLCYEHDIRAILNHRSSQEATTGHYSLLVDIDDTTMVLHDPSLGPGRRLSHDEMMELWRPTSANSEIIGNVVIAVAGIDKPAEAVCEFCHTPIPPKVVCPRCQKPVSLRPSEVLGCIAEDCIARMWNYLCCPTCDYTWNFRWQPAVAVAAPEAPAAPETNGPSQTDPWNLAKVFGELDRFCSHVMSLPSVANRADVKAHIDLIQASKEKLTLAQGVQLARHRTRAGQLAALKAAAEASAEAHHRKVVELNAPAPSLDGNTIGRALLKNLGFTA